MKEETLCHINTRRRICSIECKRMRTVDDCSSWRKRLRSIKEDEHVRKKRQEEKRRGERGRERGRVSLLVPGTGHLAERSFIIVSVPPL